MCKKDLDALFLCSHTCQPTHQIRQPIATTIKFKMVTPLFVKIRRSRSKMRNRPAGVGQYASRVELHKFYIRDKKNV